MIRKLPQAAGAGVSRFGDGSAKFATTSSSGALNRYQLSIGSGDTYMTVKKAGSYRRMPDLLVDAVLYGAYQEMEHQIAHYGGNSPLSDDYGYSRGGLTLVVWQNKSPEEAQYKVTYQTVRDMLTGPRAGLWQIENIECAVDPARVVDDRNHPIGHGILMFQDCFSRIYSDNATKTKQEPTWVLIGGNTTYQVATRYLLLRKIVVAEPCPFSSLYSFWILPTRN